MQHDVNHYPQLYQLLAAWLAESDLEGLEDEAAVAQYVATEEPDDVRLAYAQAQALRCQPELAYCLAAWANRHFADEQAARTWLDELLVKLSAHLD